MVHLKYFIWSNIWGSSQRENWHLHILDESHVGPRTKIELLHLIVKTIEVI